MRPVPTYTKDTFAEAFKQGDEKGFNHFFDQLYPALCFFGARLIGDKETAKEIASDAFIKTWSKHEQLDSATSIKAYLYQVARNDCYKWLHKQQKMQALHKDLAALSVPVEQSHLDLLINSEVIASLHLHINQLPEGCKKVFNKLYIEGKSVTETAHELDLADSTVKTQKARGLLYLKKQFTIS